MTINDNFGFMIAGHFSPFGSGTSFIFKNINGDSRVATCYGTNLANRFNKNPNNNRVQVGKGSSPATKQDVDIESPFTNSPESTRVQTGASGYNSGLGQITTPTLIAPTGGSGTITEVCLFGQWHDSPIDEIVLIYRDIVTPSSFIISESINVEHITQI